MENTNLHYKKKKKSTNLSRKNLLTIGAAVFFGIAIITIPLVTVANWRIKDPRLQVQNQAKLITNIQLKDEYQNGNLSYFDLKKQLFNADNTKKTGIDYSQFFDFYQKNNTSLPINFATDYGWNRYKLDVFDLKPLDQEQSFEIYYRLVYQLPDDKKAISDLLTQKVIWNYLPDYSLANFANFSSSKLEKLRAYTNKEFSLSTKKELTKLVKLEEFEKQVNWAINNNEARKIINKYFNLEEIIAEILNNKEFSYLDESGIWNPRYQIELVRDQILGQDFLAKTGQKGIYKLTFYAAFSPNFAKKIAADLNKSSKFHFGINIDLNNLFLDKTVAENIKITEFSEDDYYPQINFEKNLKAEINGWDFLNYYNNQIFATQNEREDFLKKLIAKIVRTPLLKKVEFENKLSGIDYAKFLKYLKLDIKLDANSTKLAFRNNQIVAKIFGKIILRNAENQIVAEKNFSQTIEHLNRLGQNDAELVKQIKQTKFEFKPETRKKIANQKGAPKSEILALLNANKFDKLKNILENGDYYGYEFNEDRLKLLVHNSQLPNVEEFAKLSVVPEKMSEGIINLWNKSFKTNQEVSTFLSLLAKRDISFVAKYWYDLLNKFKLIDPKTQWPENLDQNSLFKHLSQIKIQPPEKKAVSLTSDFWLFSLNNDYLISPDYLNNSFYLHSNLKNTLDLIKTESAFSTRDFVEHIRELAKSIKPKDFIQEKGKNPITNLSEFLVAFYSLIYSKDQGLLAESLGQNLDYKIQFELEPISLNVAVSQEKTNLNNNLRLKYWYKIGSVDQNGNLIQVIYQTKKETLDLVVNENNKLLSEDVEKLNEIATNFPSADQIIFLKKEDYTQLVDSIKQVIKTVNTPVKIDNEIKNLPFSQFFENNYPDYGFYIIKTSKNLESSKPEVTKPVAARPEAAKVAAKPSAAKPVAAKPEQQEIHQSEEIPGVLTNTISQLGNQIRHNFDLYVYKKDQPQIHSSKPVRVIIIESSESLFALK
ncbi:hypothetical protein DR088_00640 [Mycoplasma hyopneumoniae]|uniref:P97 family multifunctional adhesin Mhp385 n=1 Tax=Mesomycoplasma hyopneumoniae TaxID=2099 RepID=UPI00136FE4B5|nr:P97 family multifunctional adhesin Mhp385 [Mesomycoplasma hyopneumoniae]MXR10690.1 hypothetical protein [Mesomycoplasma hyopneumoniae]